MSSRVVRNGSVAWGVAWPYVSSASSTARRPTRSIKWSVAVLSEIEIIRVASSRTDTDDPAGSSCVVPDGIESSSSRIVTGVSHDRVPPAIASTTAPST